MTEEEPTTEEFFGSIVDIAVSNRAVDTVRRKFQAQSFYQFFNRVWATGLLLFVFGTIGLGLALASQEYQFSILDITNTLFLVGAIVVIWFILTIVGVVNEGEDPIFAESGPNKSVEILKVATGLAILILLAYQLFWQSSTPMESVMLFILAALLTSMWLLAVSWLLGGISGLLQLRDREQPE